MTQKVKGRGVMTQIKEHINLRLMAVSVHLKVRRKETVTMSYAINLFIMFQGRRISNHIYFDCLYYLSCQFLLFDVFTLPWIFSDSRKAYEFQPLCGIEWNSQSVFTLGYAVKTILFKLWMERNQDVF